MSRADARTTPGGELSAAPRCTDILLVEDSRTDARLLELRLRGSTIDAMTLTHVTTLAEAMSTLQARRFDVLLLDLSLPDADGLEGVQALSHAARDLPIVVLTGSDDDLLAVNAVKAGAQDFLVKGRGEAETIVRALRYAIERKETQRQLERLAWYDGLTGLANRALFTDRLDHAISRGKRLQQRVGLIYLDLDGFKPVNDEMGHAAGDAVIAEVGRRLRATVRESDTVARLGGDEFAVVLEGVGDDEALTQVAAKLLEAVSVPIDVDDRQAQVSASLGISAFPEDGQDRDGLVRSADGAMYRAKQAGGGRYCLVGQARCCNGDALRSLASRLRESVRRGEFLLLYQPVLELATGAVAAAEALLRWRPEGAREPVEPREFLDLAEESGLMVPLGEWVLRRACRQSVAWRRELGRPLPVSVNISASQFVEPGFATLVATLLAETGLEARHLLLEVTEAMLQQDGAEPAAVLRALRRTGTSVLVDDFGAGCSSLAALRGLPLEQVKLAPDFVADVSAGQGGEVAAAIVQLAHALGMRCTAEAIENEAQATHLRACGCDYGQGFHLARPMSAEALLDFCREPVPALSARRA